MPISTRYNNYINTLKRSKHYSQKLQALKDLLAKEYAPQDMIYVCRQLVSEFVSILQSGQEIVSSEDANGVVYQLLALWLCNDDQRHSVADLLIENEPFMALIKAQLQNASWYIDDNESRNFAISCVFEIMAKLYKVHYPNHYTQLVECAEIEALAISAKSNFVQAQSMKLLCEIMMVNGQRLSLCKEIEAKLEKMLDNEATRMTALPAVALSGTLEHPSNLVAKEAVQMQLVNSIGILNDPKYYELLIDCFACYLHQGSVGLLDQVLKAFSTVIFKAEFPNFLSTVITSENRASHRKTILVAITLLRILLRDDGHYTLETGNQTDSAIVYFARMKHGNTTCFDIYSGWIFEASDQLGIDQYTKPFIDYFDLNATLKSEMNLFANLYGYAKSFFKNIQQATYSTEKRSLENCSVSLSAISHEIQLGSSNRVLAYFHQSLHYHFHQLLQFLSFIVTAERIDKLLFNELLKYVIIILSDFQQHQPIEDTANYLHLQTLLITSCCHKLKKYDSDEINYIHRFFPERFQKQMISVILPLEQPEDGEARNSSIINLLMANVSEVSAMPAPCMHIILRHLAYNKSAIVSTFIRLVRNKIKNTPNTQEITEQFEKAVSIDSDTQCPNTLFSRLVHWDRPRKTPTPDETHNLMTANAVRIRREYAAFIRA